MRDLTAAMQNAADLAVQKAAEEAEEERARRREAIQSRIDKWDAELTSVNSQVSGLTAEQTKINTYLGEWDAQKNKYSGNDILSEVVILNVFEGVCADKIKEEFSTGITEMDRTCIRVSRLSENVSAQIARLNQCIYDINAKLTSLRNELSSI